MSKLDKFYSKYGPGDHYNSFSAEKVDRWKDRLPSFLIEEWKSYGLRSFEKGFIWFTDPDDFAEPISEWLPNLPKLVVYARSGFCDLWIWDGEQTLFLDVHYGRLLSYRGSIDLIFNFTLVQEETRKDMLNIDIFKKAHHRIGSPDPDEMYAYVPAIALGGSLEQEETIERVKLSEHLSFLSQIHDEIVVV